MPDKLEQSSDNEDFSDYCVLLVEDDEIMRLSLEDRLLLEKIPVRAVPDVAVLKVNLKKAISIL